jgi:hypothetical protein
MENHDEIRTMVSPTKRKRESSSMSVNQSQFWLLLIFNAFNSAILFGCLPSLSSYSMLPYGQKAYYYSTLLNPLAYPLGSLMSVRWPIVPMFVTIIGSMIGFLLSFFIFSIAWQSPCPWWADTIHGAFILILVWFITTFIIAYVRITIGNRVRQQAKHNRAMFYFGASVQLGMFIGTVPIYSLINIFNLFLAREPCQPYCR